MFGQWRRLRNSDSVLIASALDAAHHRLYDRTRRKGSARIVEVEDVGHTGRVRSELRHVERQRTGSARGSQPGGD